MDNLTHSLIGALLGQAGLKRKTGLATPTLIIAANLPDIDAACTVFGTLSLAMRRGLTHGPIAMLVLPLVLTAGMVVYDRWQAGGGRRPPGRPLVHRGWLLALACVGCLSHPLFDWLNSYGIRLLEPFSSRWFYGDALFIVDPWLLALLIAGIWLSRRREKAQRSDWRHPAFVSLVGIFGYVGLNLMISTWIADRARMSEPYPQTVVANPVPLTFWRREVLWRGEGSYGSYITSPWSPRHGERPPRPIGMDDPRIHRRLPQSPEARALLFWSRMPVAEVQGDTVVLGDQRFLGRGFGPFRVELD